MKTVVFGIDALEYDKVLEFQCANLKQKFFGKTDITDFSQPRTMVLWSSFMTGMNKENEILERGDKEMWNTRIKFEDTFFSMFKDPVIIDLPGYNYDLAVHEKSRKLLKTFFETKSESRKKILEEYNKDAFEHHKKVKEQFLKTLEEDHDFVLGYFSVIDVIGHLNFGNTAIMKMLYKEMDEIASKIDADTLLILSDHGMKAIGDFGDHSEYGFWSTNFSDLKNPKITEFASILKDIEN